MKKFPIIILVATAIVFFAASCSLNKGDNTNPQQGAFLVANISPDAPPLTLYSNNQQTPIQNLGSGSYTPYYQATAGAYNFSFYDSSSATSPKLSSTISISPSTDYSYFIIDSFSNVKSSFVQDNLSLPGTDSINIRFFNFSPNAGPISLYESSLDSTFYTQRSFNDQSVTSAYANFNKLKLKTGGIYNFQLRRLSDDSVLASKTDTLASGRIYTIIAEGIVGGTGTRAVGIGKIQNY